MSEPLEKECPAPLQAEIAGHTVQSSAKTIARRGRGLKPRICGAWRGGFTPADLASRSSSWPTWRAAATLRKRSRISPGSTRALRGRRGARHRRRSRMKRISISTPSTALRWRRCLPCSRASCRAAKPSHSEWVALNPRRCDRNLGSFKVNRFDGKWRDFATGDKGGDPVSLGRLCRRRLAGRGGALACPNARDRRRARHE